MSDIDNRAEIIDIAPENIIEGDAAEKIEPKPAKSWRGKIALAAGVIVLSAVGGGWAYRDFLSSYLPSDQVEAMAARMDGLEATTKTLNGKVEAVIGFTDEMKSQLAAVQTAAAEITNLKSDSSAGKSAVVNLEKALAGVNSSLEDLKAQVAAGGTGDGSTVMPAIGSAFSARLEAIEKDVASLKQAGKVAVDTTVLSQSLADLKAKIAAGTSYQTEIDRIALMVPAAEGLDILQSHAAKGLPNAAGLAAELKLAAINLPKAEPAAAPDDSWWGYASSLAAGLVTIKTSGTEDWEQVALQASALSEQGDLSAALTNLSKLEGALPVELQSWHDRASARLEVERAVEKTSAAVLRQIAAKG